MPAPPGSITVEHVHPEQRLDAEALQRLIRHVTAMEEHTLGTLTVVLADHDTVLALNREYLDHDYLTDVLSFNLSDEAGVVEGEIYVDLDTAAERHQEFGATFQQEACRYVIHGLLHLIGYDDHTAEARATMRRLEDRYLRATTT